MMCTTKHPGIYIKFTVHLKPPKAQILNSSELSTLHKLALYPKTPGMPNRMLNTAVLVHIALGLGFSGYTKGTKRIGLETES